MRWFLERIVRRVDQQYYLLECVHYNVEGFSIQYQSSESAQLIYIGGLSIQYQSSKSIQLIYIEGLSTK